jgi:hypothetical protein
MVVEKSASQSINNLLKHAAVSGATMPARKAVCVTSKSALISNDGGIDSGRVGIKACMALTLFAPGLKGNLQLELGSEYRSWFVAWIAVPASHPFAFHLTSYPHQTSQACFVTVIGRERPIAVLCDGQQSAKIGQWPI